MRLQPLIVQQAPQQRQSRFTYAGARRRAVAWLIDLAVSFLLGMITFEALDLLLGSRLGYLEYGFPVDMDLGTVAARSVVTYGLDAAYFLLLWHARATVGMILLRLRIGNAADGAAVTYRQGATRWLTLNVPAAGSAVVAQIDRSPDALLYTLSALGVAVWLVALLASVVRAPTKQGYHDRIARTLVVREQ